ncbi:MAG TPA: hypothetical protein VL125_03155 [Pelobium sp.]|nr:hypothetical protein [Pelobium sp.]
MKQQNRSVNPASECLDWSPINLSALPLLTEGYQQSAEVLQKLGNGTAVHTAWIALKRFTVVE